MHVLIRLVQVNAALWGYLIWWAWRRTGFFRSAESPANRFAATLERLGTTFVKLGQALSLHGELLPDVYLVALQKLQDHVAPFAGELARSEVEKSFGRPIAEIFAKFDAEPLAAGSIAQVHGAVMPDGAQVIVKIRRPGIKRQIDEDIRILRWFIKSVIWVIPGFRRVKPMEIIDELARNLRKEIDFRNEAFNIARFVEIFSGSRAVYVPAVVGNLYSDWVMVQEMSMGRRIDDDAFAADGPRLARALVDAFLHQFFVAGVFHGDPHPGNLFVVEDGRICLHDFGLVGFLDRPTRANLVAFMEAFTQQDGEWLLDACIGLGILSGKLDRREFRSGLEELIADYARMPLKDWSFGAAFLRIARMGQGQNVRIPHNLLVFLRAVFLMESTVSKLDPEFNLLEGLFARAQETLRASVGPASADELMARLKYESLLSLKELPAGIGRLLHRLRTDGIELSVNHHGFEKLERELDRVGGRISLALITLGLYIAASLLMQHSIGPRFEGVPILGAIGYALALWFTWHVVRDIANRDK